MTSRRDMLRHLTLTSLAVSPLGAALRAAQAIPVRPIRAHEHRADLIIIGGGTGGCAAALAACTRGLRVVMTEESGWIGGQFTAQAVPPDENKWIESIGGTRTYRQLRTAVRDHYRANPRLLDRARQNPRLNPGNGWVSRVCAEPRVWLAAIEAQLAPYLASGQLQVLHHTRAVAADVDRDVVRSVRVRQADGSELLLEAPYVVDATELGELSALCGAELVMGAESRAMTGEPHALDEAQPDNQQSFTVVFAMEYRPGEQHVIDRPADYARWRRETVSVNGTAWPLLGFDEPANKRIGFDPDKRTGYWSYRRIIDHTLFAPGTYAGDVTLVNWWQNDYHHGPLVGVPQREATAHVQAAGALSLSLLYWLQTEAPRPDGGTGWPGLKLRPDIVGTDSGLAMTPYVRESRRLLTRRTVREQDVLRSLLPTGTETTAFADSVGIGHYAMDLHRTTRGDSGGYGDTVPFQIPLGALVPVRLRNLLPACKNFGVTHLTNGCYRLHPIEWNAGEAVGHLVAHAITSRRTPEAIHANATHTADYQRELQQAGIGLSWPTPLPAK
ncbi:FAD-dependent oxidoreductase [Gemmatimonas sp. UBA7669]|uniref:FAD-dependent oxidoreductase n=1 Tax=Gemmatimonas sp. UBA7669 TaxID=1946568 RepID=UPI0025B88F28|nr:FAD-dependent oxidoreductase [Gemmatimonas sp. UBA7669]